MESKQIARPMARSPERREQQLIDAAITLAEKQLRDGTATAQVITHFLKLGTEQSKLELEKIKRENELLAAKAESISSNARLEEIYEEALKAMREYSVD